MHQTQLSSAIQDSPSPAEEQDGSGHQEKYLPALFVLFLWTEEEYEQKAKLVQDKMHPHDDNDDTADAQL
jgi:hypothetical protein